MFFYYYELKDILFSEILSLNKTLIKSYFKAVLRTDHQVKG